MGGVTTNWKRSGAVRWACDGLRDTASGFSGVNGLLEGRVVGFRGEEFFGGRAALDEALFLH